MNLLPLKWSYTVAKASKKAVAPERNISGASVPTLCSEMFQIKPCFIEFCGTPKWINLYAASVLAKLKNKAKADKALAIPIGVSKKD